MKTKTVLLSVIYSAIAAVAATFILQSVAGLAEQAFTTAAIVVFVCCFVCALLSGASGGAPSPVVEGALVEDDDENDSREAGTVKWFNVTKGFGFITRDQGDDVFVHFRSIRGTGHRSLAEGQRVRFEVVKSDKGLQAEDVSILRS